MIQAYFTVLILMSVLQLLILMSVLQLLSCFHAVGQSRDCKLNGHVTVSLSHACHQAQ